MFVSKRIGIIGLGWLGESLGDFLLSKGFSVWGTVRTSDKAERIRKKGIDVVQWESSSEISEALQREISKSDVLVLNLPPSVFSGVNYATGLCSFLPFLSSHARVLHTSSTGVYPEHLQDAIETYVFQTEDSNHLLEAENALQEKLSDRLCRLRLAGLIGEDRNPVNYLAKTEVNSDPDKPINLIHRKDILRIVLQIIKNDQFGEVFNVCHPDHPSRKDYYTKKAQQFNLGEIRFENQGERQAYKIVNCCKLRQELNYNQFEAL